MDNPVYDAVGMKKSTKGESEDGECTMNAYFLQEHETGWSVYLFQAIMGLS